MSHACSLGLILGTGIGLAAMAAQPSLATPVDPEILEQIGPRVINPGLSKRQLVEMGRKLFFEETFEGNGRTCGTCHPATNNFTIDPEFIQALHEGNPRDPLFVAEFNPDLANLENPTLMREFGLILENLDGFERPGVMRGVPHNLGMPMSLTPDPDDPLPGPEGNRIHAIGWSGDGSPGEGSLRLFSVGAVVQHFPKRLNRVEGVDFRLPTDLELDAMEAFMLSVGRQSDVDLSEMTFADENVQRGKLLFNNEDEINDRACSGCHHNAGANTDDGVNANFDTGTRLISLAGPPEGGFGDQHEDLVPGFGDGTMNTPSLIEAADTPPFFHNNAADTLEEAINFYTSSTFAGSAAGGFGGVFDLDKDEVNAIGGLLRTLNAMENIRYSNLVSEQAQRTVPPAAAMARIQEVVSDTDDAIEVLTKGPLSLYPNAVELLRDALQREAQASNTIQTPRRNALLREAASLKRQASALMVD